MAKSQFAIASSLRLERVLGWQSNQTIAHPSRYVRTHENVINSEAVVTRAVRRAHQVFNRVVADIACHTLWEGTSRSEL